MGNKLTDYDGEGNELYIGNKEYMNLSIDRQKATIDIIIKSLTQLHNSIDLIMDAEKMITTLNESIKMLGHLRDKELQYFG